MTTSNLVLAVDYVAAAIVLLVIGSGLFNALKKAKTWSSGGSVGGNPKPPSTSPSKPDNLTLDDHIARERARALYEERAAALRQQSSSGSAPPAVPAPSKPPATTGSPSLEAARERARQIARMRRERESQSALPPPAPPQRAAQLPPPVPASRPTMRPAAAKPPPPPRRPAPPSARPAAKPAPSPANRTTQEAVAAAAAVSPTSNPAANVPPRGLTRTVATARAANTIPAHGDREAIVLTRGSVREAFILREVLDPPLALRRTQQGVWDPA
ncbi:MAG: hypothetical protein NTW19_12790 [Planctomycetota bacterium]|nr:hypothetical protein [Planctomycetota bacterium]